MDNKIEKEEWKKYFMDLLNDSEIKPIERRDRLEEVQLEEEIEEAEVKRALKKMKIKKATEIDEIPTEPWKYVRKKLWNRLVKMMKQI